MQRQLIPSEQIPAQGAGADGEHDVVDGGVHRRADRLDPIEGKALRHKAPRARYPGVDRGARHIVPGHREVAAATDKRQAKAPHRRRQVRAGVVLCFQRFEHVAQIAPRGLWRTRFIGAESLPLVGFVGGQGKRRVAPGALGIVAAHRARDVHGPDTVDGRMVHFAVERELAIFKSFDNVQLPQRARAVEQGGVQPGDQRKQLPIAPRRRQGGMTDMVVHVDLRIGLPKEPCFASDHTVAKGLAKLPGSAQLLGQLAEKLRLIDAAGPRKQIDTADVHGRFAPFKKQQAGAGEFESSHGGIPPRAA